MIRFLTAGESHGKGLTVIVDGFPSNLEVTKEQIDFHLRRRQMGYGRGGRMKIETDGIDVISGLRFGKTLGTPISMVIWNSDWENWTERMDHENVPDDLEKITIPRPGHADLVGTTKYNFDDIRNSIERSSARETAGRVAAGSFARKLLEEFGISIGSFVESIGGIYPSDNMFQKLLDNDTDQDFKGWSLSEHADKSQVRVLEEEQELQIIDKVKQAKKRGDTLGGNMVAVATGIPAGLGSFMQYDRRLDAKIAHDMMSINAVKGVELGYGFKNSDFFGSEVHDEIVSESGKFSRKTNHAGGIEGGMSTGLPILVRASMKPIATLMSPIETVDLATGESVMARRERSDFMAVPACAVIMEAMFAWSLAEFMVEKFGGDSIEEMKLNYNNYINNLEKRVLGKFK